MKRSGTHPMRQPPVYKPRLLRGHSPSLHRVGLPRAARLWQRAGCKDSWRSTRCRLFTARPGCVQYQQHILHNLRKASPGRNYNRHEKELGPRITDRFFFCPSHRNASFISKWRRRVSCVGAPRCLFHGGKPGDSRYPGWQAVPHKCAGTPRGL